MQAKAKVETAEERAQKMVPVSMISKWVRQAIDSAVATQRIVLDLAVRQNATTIDAFRGKPGVSRAGHEEGFAAMAGEYVSNFVQAERILLHTILQQNEIMLTGTRERIGNPRAAMLIDVIGRSIETFVDMQQHFLTLADKQTKAWVKQAPGAKPGEAMDFAEIIRQGTETFVKSQKKLLDAVAEAAKAANAGKSHEKNRQPVPKRFPELLRESAGSLIDMQKKLSDLAGSQMGTNLKAARRAADLLPSARIDVIELTRQYVNNLVVFEESLLDLFVKPRAAAPAPPAPRAARTTTRRARKTATKVAPSTPAAV